MLIGASLISADQKSFRYFMIQESYEEGYQSF